ncbi:MAG: YbaK/EbsC family protein, partial [bacterium]
RHVMLLAGEESMKEAVAFPMSGTGKTSVMDAPSSVDPSQLAELGIKVVADAKNVVFDKLQKLIDYSDKDFKVIEHKSVLTSEEASKVRGISLDKAVKAMVLKDKSGKLFMVCIPADKKVDFKKVEEEYGKKVSFADSEEVEVELGLKVGSVPPVGKIFQIETYYERSIEGKGKIVFSAGRRDRSIVMDSKDLISVAEPSKVGEFC